MTGRFPHALGLLSALWLIAIASLCTLHGAYEKAEAQAAIPYRIRASVDRSNPYRGELFIYKVDFLSSVNLNSSPNYQAPVFDGFWQMGEPFFTFGSETIEGSVYSVTTINTFLYAVDVGQFTIPEARIRVTNGEVSALQSASVLLQVRELPQPVPPNFFGAIGQFRISAETDMPIIKVGDILTLHLTVSGFGNLDQLTSPHLNLPDAWFAYQRAASFHLQTENITQPNQAMMSYSYVWSLAPKQSGTYRLEGINWVYFDPDLEAYKTATADPIEFTVETEQASASEYSFGGSLRLKESVEDNVSLSLNSGLLSSWPVWSVFPAITLLALGIRYLRALRASPLRVAKRRLQKIAQYAEEGNDEQQKAEFYDIICQYFAASYNLDPKVVDQTIIERILNQGRIEPSALERLEQIFLARFDPEFTLNTPQSARELVTIFRSLEKRRARRIPRTAFLLLCLIVMNSCQPQATSENNNLLVDQAGKDYSQGNFDAAIAKYESLLKQGTKSLVASYNLATVWLAKGDLGRALLNYRDAQILSPRDSEVLMQIALVQRLSGQQRDTEYASHHEVQPSIFTVNEIRGGGFILWSLAWSILTFEIIVPQNRLRAYLLVLAFGLGIVSAGSLLFIHRGDIPAGVIQQKSFCYLSPDSNSITRYILPAASEVNILEGRAGWLRVELENHDQCWIADGKVGKIDGET